jgi:hypothetical protein
MCLQLVFLLITRLPAWLRLSRREEWWKTAEILILRHQRAVRQQREPRRPERNWADVWGSITRSDMAWAVFGGWDHR